MSDKLQSYILLAKGQKGRALAELVVKATGEPGLYEFGELIDIATSKEASLDSSPDTQPAMELLRLFAYGTWSDYKVAAPGKFPALSEAQQYKLKQLTVVSLARSAQQLSYDALLSTLDLPDIRTLEDFLIDCMYSGLIGGKLDQRAGCVRVSSTAGRDVSPADLASLRTTLQQWSDYSKELMEALEARAQAVAKAGEEQRALRAQQQRRVEEERAKAKKDAERAQAEAPQMMLGGIGSEDVMEMDEDLDVMENFRGPRMGHAPQRPSSKRRR